MIVCWMSQKKPIATNFLGLLTINLNLVVNFWKIND